MLKDLSLARRRFIQGIAAVGVIGFDPIRRTWLTEAEARRGGALARLPRLDGELVTDPGSLAQAADDFGHYIHRTPVAVLRPGSIRDVVEMVRYATQYRIQIAMRGQGHTTHGQAQVDAGIVIDSSTLSEIHEVRPDGVVVGPGARWRDVIAATLPLGLTPPTLPNYLDLTVGGNIAGGGIGGASHRYGAVVDNILELQVVTGHGVLRRCSERENPALFNAVLGGLGQFGIVVRARIKVVPAKELARLHILQYPDVPTFLDDARALALDERFDHVEGQVNADATGHDVRRELLRPGSSPRQRDALAGSRL
jgi:cytokinin dehydrogenase